MFEHRIRIGLALLSQEQVQSLNTHTLMMENPWCCVLGQLYGTYSRGREALRLTERRAVICGFELPPEEYDDMPWLSTEWRSAIRKAQEKR